MRKRWSIAFCLATVVILPVMSPIPVSGGSASGSLGISFGSLEPYRGQRGGGGGGSERGQSEGDRRRAEEYAKQIEISDKCIELIRQENSALERGDVREALRLIKERQGLQDGPNTRKRIAYLTAWIAAKEAADNSDAAFKKGDYDQAVAYLRLAMQHPGYINNANKLWLGDLEDRAKRVREYKVATREREEQRRRDETEAERLNDEAVLLLKAERPDEAFAKLDKAKKLFPFNDRIIANRHIAAANIAFREGRLNDVIGYLEFALRYDPGNDAAKVALALARSRRNEQSATVQAAFDESRRRLTSQPPAGTVVANVAADPRIVSAASITKQAWEIENSPGAREATKAFQAVVAHDWPAGLAWYQQALLKDPNNAALQRMVDLGSYTLERQRKASYSKADWERLDAILEQIYWEGEIIPARSEGTARPAPSISSDTREVLVWLKPTSRGDTSIPREQEIAAAKTDRRKYEEMFTSYVIESWAEDAGRRAAMHLLSGKRKEAVTELRDAEQMAPGVPNYRNALKAVTGGDEQRNFVGKRVRANLDFISN